MDLKPGQTILLKSTRERARVIEALEEGKFVVEAAMDAERFTVHEDEIDPVVGTGQRAARVATDKAPPAGDIQLYPDADGPAVQLACVPLAQLDYEIALLNFSRETLMYATRLVASGRQQWAKPGLIGPSRGLMLGYLYRDHLNENAEVEVQVSRKTDSGTDSLQRRTIKLKPKTFFKNATSVSWHAEQVTLFDVFAAAKVGRAEPAPPQQAQPSQQPATAPAPARKNPHGVTSMAEFPDALDLHAERLLGDTSRLTSGEIVDQQLRHVAEYLEAAIRVGIPRVHIVHGKGSGVLRKRVHELLDRMGDIEGYRAEYHPKYGNGATTVQLLPER